MSDHRVYKLRRAPDLEISKARRHAIIRAVCDEIAERGHPEDPNPPTWVWSQVWRRIGPFGIAEQHFTRFAWNAVKG